MAENTPRPPATIRCPGCGEAVALPAPTTCEKCGYNFREGRRPPPPVQASFDAGEGGSKSRLLLIAGAAGFLLAALAYFVFFSSGSPEPQVPTASPGGGGSVLQPVGNAPPNPLLNPAVPIRQARGAAAAADERADQLRELNGQLEQERQGDYRQ